MTAIPPHTPDQPFVLELTATATLRILIAAPDIDTADDIADGRFEELRTHLQAQLGLPDHPGLEYDILARPALYQEASQQADPALRLTLDVPQLDICESCALIEIPDAIPTDTDDAGTPGPNPEEDA